MFGRLGSRFLTSGSGGASCKSLDVDNAGDGDEESSFFEIKQGLKKVTSATYELDVAVQQEKKRLGAGCDHALNPVHAALAQLSINEQGNVSGFPTLYKQAQELIAKEQRDVKMSVLGAIDTSKLQKDINEARDLKHAFYKARAKQERASNQVQALVRSGGKDAGTTKLTSQIQVTKESARQKMELEQEAVHAMLRVSEFSELFTIKTMREILQQQLDSARRQVEALEETCAQAEELEALMAREQEEHQAERREREEEMKRNRARFDHLAGKNIDFDVLCKDMPNMKVHPHGTLPNEGTVQRIEKCVLLSAKQPIPGVVLVTTYRIIFLPYQAEVNSKDVTIQEEQAEETKDITDGDVETNRFRVLYDFDGSDEDELTVRVGDPLILLEDHENGWMHVQRPDSDDNGLVPTDYLEKELLPAAPSDVTVSMEAPKPSDLSITTNIASYTHRDGAWSVPLSMVSHVLPNEEGKQLTVYTEDLASFSFVLSFAATTVDKLAVTIESFAFSPTNLFAFYFKPQVTTRKFVYDKMKEFDRMGLCGNPLFRITEANEKYLLCPSYPDKLCVLQNTDDEMLFHSAKVRSKQRLPVICWKGKQSRNSLLRSSQPLLSLSGVTDAQALAVYADTSIDSTLQIFDARPQLYAVANMGKRGGWENNFQYKRVNVTFLNIDNIHAVRSSFIKLHGLFTYILSENKEVELLEQILQGTHRTQDAADIPVAIMNNFTNECSWFDHISSIVNGANQVVQALDLGKTTLVHCSDGWDRTAQLTSLATLLLDPYYRTIEGFEILIEKEWVSFGHKFATRHGLGGNEMKSEKRDDYLDKQRAPIFIQFLDCVYQLCQQRPEAFEFNVSFLETIFHHCYACAFGTFLFNNERERVENKLNERTPCLWDSINSDRAYFISKEFDPNTKSKITVSSQKSSFHLWPIYSTRWAF
mmetsp:Transcript_19506/g.32560  ORF Transcript_19506/g.32560 Transcript_19506/m.32560 type:complete len:932 (-) Transcript_19506:103-2898(-)